MTSILIKFSPFLATDQGAPQRSNTSQVNIKVKNTNDNAPTFVPGSPIVYVSEAVAIGTKIVKFNATDEDGNKLTFSVSKGNTNSALVIDKDTGLLTTRTKLDRETVARYNLTVTVTESTNGQGAQSSSQNLSVIVTDENDNIPLFDPQLYTVAVDETKAAGMLAQMIVVPLLYPIVQVYLTGTSEHLESQKYFSLHLRTKPFKIL